jgi:hypothetical protein
MRLCVLVAVRSTAGHEPGGGTAPQTVGGCGCREWQCDAGRTETDAVRAAATRIPSAVSTVELDPCVGVEVLSLIIP